MIEVLQELHTDNCNFMTGMINTLIEGSEANDASSMGSHPSGVDISGHQDWAAG